MLQPEIRRTTKSLLQDLKLCIWEKMKISNTNTSCTQKRDITPKPSIRDEAKRLTKPDIEVFGLYNL